MTDNKLLSRRGFLKTAAAISAALTVTPAISKVRVAEATLSRQNGDIIEKGGMTYRILGSGEDAMEVSASPPASARQHSSVLSAPVRP